MFGKFLPRTASTTAFIALIIASPQNLAQEVDAKVTREGFNTVYRAFREASESGNRKETYELAVEALRIGEVVFGEGSKSVAALTMNAALAYPTDWRNLPDSGAVPLMRKLVSRYLQVYGSSSPELGEPYVLLAESLFGDFMFGSVDAAKEIGELRRKVEALSQEFPDDLNWDSLRVRILRMQVAGSKEAAEVLLASKVEMHGEDHPETLNMKYYLANVFLKGRKKQRLFLELVDHENLDPLLRFGVLQDLAENGPRKRRDEFRDRITNFTVIEDTNYSAAEMLPRVKVAPEYPSEALRRVLEGWVIVEFEVTSQGRVKSPMAVASCVKRQGESDCQSHSSNLFDRAAINAVKQFLYIPRFVDGRPVPTRGVQNRVTFELRG